MNYMKPVQGWIQDFPLGGRQPSLEGAPTSNTRHFSVKTYVKTKEFGPVGGGCAPETFVCRSATAVINVTFVMSHCQKNKPSE